MKVYILMTSVDYEDSTIIKGVYFNELEAVIKKEKITKEFEECSDYSVEYFDQIWIEPWEVINGI